MAKPTRVNKEPVDNKQGVPESTLPDLVKLLIERAKIGFTKHSITIKKTKEPRVYSARLQTKQLLQTVTLKHLYKLFKERNIKILDGTTYVGFSSDKINPRTVLEFKFKMLKTAKPKSKKRFRLKIGNKTQQKIQAFFKEING